MACLSTLPAELQICIVEYLQNTKDISSLSQCNHALYWLVIYDLFNAAFRRQVRFEPPHCVFRELFFYAVKLDSRYIIQWLISNELGHQLREHDLLLNSSLTSMSYLHFAILNDAPHVAIELVKHGVYIEDLSEHPDLEPLYLAMSIPQLQPAHLSGPLHIAAGYALPRTTRLLLVKGADPNHLSRFGLAPFHTAVRRRPPWRRFGHIRRRDSGSDMKFWRELLVETLSVLLDFGGDPNLASRSSRVHVCGPECWKSPDCEHGGRTSLHFASAHGIGAIITLLLRNGANPITYDEGGNLPVYYAIANGHCGVALHFLQKCAEPDALVVSLPRQSTALHVAARFGDSVVVGNLLQLHSDANLRDATGRTAVDEAMEQTNPNLEARISTVLDLLSGSDASSTSDRCSHTPSTNDSSDLTEYLTAEVREHRSWSANLGPKVRFASTSQPALRELETHSIAAFPALNSSNSKRDETRMNHNNSPWYDEDKRTFLLSSMTARGAKNDTTLADPSIQPDSQLGDPKIPRIHSTSDIERSSARFWSALAERDSGHNGHTISHAQLPTRKSRSKKNWIPLEW